MSFFEWISKADEGIVIVMIVVTAGAIVGIVAVLAAAWRWARDVDYRARLTAMMLQRGMNPDEIERILRAGGPPAKPSDAAFDEPETRLVKELADHYYDGDDINTVLEAAREHGPIDDSDVRFVRPMAESWVSATEIARALRSRRPGRTAAPGTVTAARPA